MKEHTKSEEDNNEKDNQNPEEEIVCTIRSKEEVDSKGAVSPDAKVNIKQFKKKF